MTSKKIIIDTDIGDDIDDALAIAYAVKAAQLDLVGVTTVFRDTDTRARMAKKLLTLLGQTDVPVIAGCGDTLTGKLKKTPLVQYTADLDSATYAPDGVDAPAFIADCCARYGKELTVVGIGPYSNLARTVERFPRALTTCEKVVVMGGTFFEHHREWNVLCDVEAAKILYESGVRLECVGFDATKHTGLCRKQFDYITSLHGNSAEAYLGELTRLWSRSTWRTATLHDPLTVYYVAHPEILSMREVHAVVETKGAFTRGFTVNLDTCDEGLEHLSAVPRIRVAQTVDAKRLTDDFMKTVFNYV